MCTCPAVVVTAYHGRAQRPVAATVPRPVGSDLAEDVIAVVRAGARGYVTKTIGAAELTDAVQRVHDGDAVFSPRLAGFVLDTFSGEMPAPADPELDHLTARSRRCCG